MKIVKNINNNFAIAVDGKGNELVVSGKGIGFGKVPREITDLKVINHSYYDIDDIYISMINDIPERIIDISERIIDQANMRLENPVNSNVVITLADHINFSIQRYQKNIKMQLPIVNDIEQLFDAEVALGKYGLKLIKTELGISLPKEEAMYIALHIINSEEQQKTKYKLNADIIEKITECIEDEYEFKIDRDNFNYSRFVSHMHYLIKRIDNKKLMASKNADIYRKVIEEYPKANLCAEEISEYLGNVLNVQLTDEEKLYLILHINRLCTREDCNQ